MQPGHARGRGVPAQPRPILTDWRRPLRTCAESGSPSDRRLRGVEGFRLSHFDALATQRLLARLQSPQRVASFETVELVSLVTQDATRADRFIKRTLGNFESASSELRTAVRTFVNEQCNA